MRYAASGFRIDFAAGCDHIAKNIGKHAPRISRL
jgi:hypothetical protein